MEAVQSIENVLDKKGLDKTFWLGKFKTVGIENSRQLQHADRNVFNKLCQQKRYAWEENALKACFPLISEERKEKQGFIEKMDKSLKEILQNLDRITEEKERMSRMKINVQIPPGERNLHKELAKMELLNTELAGREKLTSSEVVSKISSGRVLRGYYIHKDAWQRVVPRKQLINIPEDVEILGPRMEETFTSREFFSEEKAGLYDHVVQHWGLNATASVGVIGAFTADIGFSMKSTDDGSRSEISQEGYTEIKETVFVPTASFTLENVSYFITPEALDELIQLESRLTEENSNKLCTEFFNTFGSHYFAGTYHFGGRYTRSVICRTETKMTKSESIKLSKWALQGGGVGMVDWCLFGGRAQYESNDDESRSKFKEDVDYKVEKKIIKCGGPAEADSIPQWKLGLVKYPATWNIIDQDVHKEEWRGVWELLRDDLSPKFKDIENLRATLKKAWEDEFKEKLQTIKTEKRVFLHVP
ncbi:interferon-induced very large GTPase 1-like [Crassostrea virginica]